MIEVYFDGACAPNPYGRIGYGAIIFNDGKIVYEISKEYKCGSDVKTTNNMAEYCAAYAALKYLIYKNWQQLPIIFRGDSQLVINQLSGKWQIGKGAYTDIACRTKDLIQHFSRIQFEWLPREFNGLADKLSWKAIGLS